MQDNDDTDNDEIRQFVLELMLEAAALPKREPPLPKCDKCKRQTSLLSPITVEVTKGPDGIKPSRCNYEQHTRTDGTWKAGGCGCASECWKRLSAGQRAAASTTDYQERMVCEACVVEHGGGTNYLRVPTGGGGLEGGNPTSKIPSAPRVKAFRDGQGPRASRQKGDRDRGREAARLDADIKTGRLLSLEEEERILGGGE